MKILLIKFLEWLFYIWTSKKGKQQDRGGNLPDDIEISI